ncbi:isoprenylcysteine carboxylmethyltransferase family protein [Hyphomicrobium sp.]|jgi:protein-S-isoprenylcysteine O-methyltransferase Ste14|uniref:methyltransferase family protein n=1 Tax=Hyphomicrobium sp. TaxID=82 RepID=UPI002CD5D3C1|nr:isoprenylcysteine carboxylmethyltransferase family protein [Hyphomicrobium sp.]HVZ05326.1 isoprenylcysteine carboxylmethyltransferase family protein [Hyphomicrobium sp.]
MAGERNTNLASKLITQILLWFAVTAMLLFVPAGTLRWPSAWIYLALWLLTGTWSGLVLVRQNPDILRERMRPLRQQAQKSWDRPVLMAILVGWVALHVVAGLDFRTGLSFVPRWLTVVGAVAFVFATYIFHVVMRENSYASPLVKIDAERGHKVISTGPYAWVRHPMYGAAIPYFIGVPLLLGSWYALAIGFLLIGILALRAVWEEQTLMTELPGYTDYAQRVRYRLVPWVW